MNKSFKIGPHFVEAVKPEVHVKLFQTSLNRGACMKNGVRLITEYFLKQNRDEATLLSLLKCGGRGGAA